MNAKNLLGIVNRGSSWLKLNALAQELVWFGLENQIFLVVEWVPRERNTLEDEFSDFSYFGRLRGQPDALPEVGAAVQTAHYRSVRIGREQPLREVLLNALVHAVGRRECLCIRLGWEDRLDLLPLQDCRTERRKLQHNGEIASMAIPLWESATWWIS